VLGVIAIGGARRVRIVGLTGAVVALEVGGTVGVVAHVLPSMMARASELVVARGGAASGERDREQQGGEIFMVSSLGGESWVTPGCSRNELRRLSPDLHR